jgi:hypothetical protein
LQQALPAEKKNHFLKKKTKNFQLHLRHALPQTKNKTLTTQPWLAQETHYITERQHTS